MTNEKFSITHLPDDILKIVNKKNWEKVYDQYMVVEVFKKEGRKLSRPLAIDHYEYIWKTDFMKEFIKAILEN